MVGKEVKKKQVAALSEGFSKSRGTFLVNCIGLNVEEMTNLRKTLKSKQANITVIRNTLACLVLEKHLDMKVAYESFMKGPNAFVMAFGEDVPSVARTLQDLKEESEAFQIKCGLLDGSSLSAKEVAELAKLPSKEVLQARFLAVLSASPSKFLGTLQAVPEGFVRIVNSYKESKNKQTGGKNG